MKGSGCSECYIVSDGERIRLLRICYIVSDDERIRLLRICYIVSDGERIRLRKKSDRSSDG